MLVVKISKLLTLLIPPLSVSELSSFQQNNCATCRCGHAALCCEVRLKFFAMNPYFFNPCCLKCGSKHQIKYKAYVAPCWTCHDKKNMDLKRPMSPHLTVYAPTLPAMTSIAQRATGSVLVFYALLMSFGTLFLSNGVETYVDIIQSMNLGSITIIILKFILGLPFTYHYFNGMRYVAWNAGKLLRMRDVYDTGKKAMIAGVIFAVLFAFL